MHFSRSKGFSLLELLIVIGIVSLLLALLLPVVTKVRQASRATKCLANVQQWGHACQMYMSNNRGRLMANRGAETWDAIATYLVDPKVAMLCLEADSRQSDQESRGGVDYPWVWKNGESLRVGSYGINTRVLMHSLSNKSKAFFSFPLKNASTIPVLGDSTYPYTQPNTGDAVPASSKIAEASSGVTSYCLDRHAMAVNIVFCDGHAERVALAGLWKLNWAANYQPSDVEVR